jgi:serine/threonine-protein kinase
MGRIYYATQAPLDRPVALKVVEADAVNEQESQFLKRFLQEASILAKLQHPNVVTLFDYGRVEGAVERYFIAMEYLAGDTLGQRLKAKRILPIYDVLSIFRQIARGLREAHARGIVHRDLKPSNVILVPQGDGGELVKIVDFGIGKMVENRPDFRQDLTQEGMMVGTPRYMAPEQFEGAVSPASDLYALGTIVYQALTGSLPFQGTTLPEFMVAKFAHPIPRMHDLNPQCEAPENLEAIVLRLLERKPEQRMSLDELFQHLPTAEEEVFGTSGARLNMTGAMPPAPTSRRSLQDPSKTSVMAPTPPTGVTGPHQQPMNLTYTPRPMSTSAAPHSAPPQGRGTPVAIAVFGTLLVVGLAIGGISLYRSRSAAPAGPPPTAVVSSELPPRVAATAFTLAVDSTPPGAIVMEGELTLGTTPMTIAIERASVTSTPRTFVLKKDGFLAGTLVQGPSDANVKTVVALAPEPAATVKSKPPVPKAPPTPPSKPPPTGNSDLDIRLKR